MQCPNIVPKEELDLTNLEVEEFATNSQESPYIFYRHNGRPVQFCHRIGRKTDVFECLNESEWKHCYAYCDLT
jgi:hypothetical protein